MREDVVIKGSRDGLLLVVNEAVEFEHMVEQLKAKLGSAVNFFTPGTVVQMSPLELRLLTAAQQEELIGLFAEYGITLQEALERRAENGKAELEALTVESAQTLVVTRTLRGGQEIFHNGSVILMGDVNPGAKVIAGGNIVIHGTCRGIVHAGFFGDDTASITADRLLAAQIRIANVIARAPDELDKSERVETARIQDSVIVIGPANK
ncbi:septum site-determining protein MinC|uniref:Probable septum site-determining protein MinC n=1 Tax=Dendrosporobacter quercicolus TaxID=146817 RepID=A0A1G9N1D5_9FIRM|nr:septum site-determining protein MinC [Dendrosporobacter quercicolus]NSL47198.1 septum site-determining protein MinC [Dendrosporobacter quercicolus DSM 1736]SDL80174.1 septum site-determining protein MinC [Dendrosporobacter quercicolus]